MSIVSDRTNSEGRDQMHEDLLTKLEQRLGRVHAKQRLGIETDHEAQLWFSCQLSEG